MSVQGSINNNGSIAHSLVDLLKKNKLTIATVESCTGGMIASGIVDVPGASAVLKYGLVTYTNEAKIKLAGVNEATLEEFTAVSEQTAGEMVAEKDNAPKADVLVSVTGYAGPDDTIEEPKGLVFIGCNVRGKVTVRKFRFEGSRDEIRREAAKQAMILAGDCIMQYVGM